MADRTRGADAPPLPALLASLQKAVRDYERADKERQRLAPALKRLRSAVDQLRLEVRDLQSVADSLESVVDSIERMVAADAGKPEAVANVKGRAQRSGFAAELVKQPTWVDRTAITLKRFGLQKEKAVVERLREHWGGEVKETTISSSLQKLKDKVLADSGKDHRWALQVKGPWRGWRNYSWPKRPGRAPRGN
jgi:hypothetical protein